MQIRAHVTSVTPLFPIEALVVGTSQSQLLKNLLNRSISRIKVMKIAIIGKGNVGTALSKGLSKAGHEIKFGHRDPKEPVADAASWGEIIILAVPHENANDAIKEIQPHADGKIVIDVTNAIAEDYGLGISCTTSTAEETQKKTSQSKSRESIQHSFCPKPEHRQSCWRTVNCFHGGKRLER
jgi:NADP oxidoreductase coenzyme F420-dependent